MHISPAVMEGLERVERALEASKSKQPRFKKANSEQVFSSAMRWVHIAQEEEPPYEADSRLRDKWLSSFWKKEPHLAGVISSVNSIDANRGWHLVGGRNQVARFSNILRQAEDGAGWRQYISMQSSAYYTTDIGAITEIGRDTYNGPLRAIYHVDPTRCRLTGDRDYPLRYDLNREPWRVDDFFRLVSMKSILEDYKGLGLCAVSRVLDMAKIMLAVYNHELEQLGSRAPKGLMLLQNIGQGQWEEAMKVREARLDSDMRRYYNAVAVIAQEGVDAIDAKLIALSQLPEGFDIEVFTNLLMYAYALCIGYDPIEFWPVLAGQLGRGRETDIQHRKGTGKGGLNFMLAYQDQIQMHLPESIQFEFEQRDQEGVLLDAQVTQAWANVAATLYTGGSSTAPGPAGDKGGDGETALAPAANTINESQSILTRDEVRTMLVNAGVIPASWTNNIEDVTATDAKGVDVERYRREELLSQEHVRRSLELFPNEPIIRYSWPENKSQVLFLNAQDALRATRFTIVKPEPQQLPVFDDEIVEEEDTEWIGQETTSIQNQST